jgi:hypothetical protein
MALKAGRCFAFVTASIEEFAVAKDVKCSRKAQISGGKAAFVADA